MCVCVVRKYICVLNTENEKRDYIEYIYIYTSERKQYNSRPYRTFYELLGSEFLGFSPRPIFEWSGFSGSSKPRRKKYKILKYRKSVVIVKKITEEN